MPLSSSPSLVLGIFTLRQTPWGSPRLRTSIVICLTTFFAFEKSASVSLSRSENPMALMLSTAPSTAADMVPE